MTSAPASNCDAHNLPHLAGLLLDRLRREHTRVHALTNAAAQTFTANLLLAAGGIPSLTFAPEEVSAFTGSSAALLVNLGTLDTERRKAILQAIATAHAQNKVWVLDPVFVDASSARLEFARACLASKPTVLRCNASEFAALAGTPAAPDAVKDFAKLRGTVVALTGAVDLVTDGIRIFRIGNGHPLMTRVTAMGCAATVLVAAFTALHGSAIEAAAAALLVTGVAGEIAARDAKGPGTFQPAFLDVLFTLDLSTLVTHGRAA
ncbi:hydroxyethylthiazole kinase [Microvirga sp. KLBC 81]|uniref:hydroxyethylthiazole kinase n=1 Tax=Microvirga sp. KLBC 81 TaxID=1862707 RepID=UPI000D512F75|nr:PfkB family carbohydrate kinase [Microvirga sp. KLBC 81]PVE23631.1 hydroxyethylthiazole kinase [Microvirga sp. KLBC 81]